MTLTVDGSTTSPSSARIRFALFALALGGFGIGSSEFVALGLLPNLASDLLPALHARSAADADARAGLVISAYALGVVVGAPTIATVAARFPRKRLLAVLLGVFLIGSVASALAPSFGTLLAARFLTGLPHGAFFGIASLVAGSLMGPGKRARGVAFVLSGLTIATVVGVPAITWLGAGWRASYLVVGLVFAATLVAILLALPYQPGDQGATMRQQLRAFRRLQFWMALAIGAIGFGGLFAVFSYLAPIVTNVAGLPEAAVPLFLVDVGLGMTVGNLVGGALADRSVKWAMLGGFGLLIAGLVVLGIGAASVPVLAVGVFIVGGAAAGLGPTIQTRLMDAARNAQTLAAAVNHSALNLGNSLGALLGGATIAAGFGYLSPVGVGLALSVAGLVLAVSTFAIERSRSRRGVPTLPHTEYVDLPPVNAV